MPPSPIKYYAPILKQGTKQCYYVDITLVDCRPGVLKFIITFLLFGARNGDKTGERT